MIWLEKSKVIYLNPSFAINTFDCTGAYFQEPNLLQKNTKSEKFYLTLALHFIPIHIHDNQFTLRFNFHSIHISLKQFVHLLFIHFKPTLTLLQPAFGCVRSLNQHHSPYNCICSFSYITLLKPVLVICHVWHTVAVSV